jgi:hypothetical protein
MNRTAIISIKGITKREFLVGWRVATNPSGIQLSSLNRVDAKL